jgi:hypothetical protein
MIPPKKFLRMANVTLVLFFVGAAGCLRADDALFIGNSYTFGGAEREILQHGGVPNLVEEVAASKSRQLASMMLAAGGKDWGYHIKVPATHTALGMKKWNWVVLQDYSTKPTHIGDVEAFYRDGEALYRSIRQQSPKAKVVLFETWARAKGNSLYTGASTPKSFTDQAQMLDEVEKAYTELDRRLEAIEHSNQVLLAPVGEAFARCMERHPEINLYWTDKHHANAKGSYLAALVIYATIFQDSPKGATREFYGVSLAPDEAGKLQEIADEFVPLKKL